MMTWSFWMSLMLFCTVAPAWGADVQVQATVDRNQVGVGDVIYLTVSVTASQSINVDEPSLAGLDGFDLINTSTSISTSSSFVNGRFITQQARNFTYMLAAQRKGRLTIPPVAVQTEGQIYRTQPIEIQVTDASARRQAPRRQQLPSTPFDQMDEMDELFNQMLQRRLQPGLPPGGMDQDVKPNEAFTVQVEVDKTQAYVGEQITASFYILTRGQIRDPDTLKYPDLKGFWKEDLDIATRLNFENVVINGVAYQRALLVSYALFPIKPGKAIIDSYKLKSTVIAGGGFGFGRPYVFTKVSQPIEIQVHDIPQNRPANFTGAVGRFMAQAQFEPPTGTVNQPVTLKVRVEGQGNAKLIELPKLDLPPSFELYDQKSNARFMKDGTSFKEFEVLIIPRQPGVFDLPPVKMAVFDPESKKFLDVVTKPLSLTVTGTATTPGPAVPSATPGTSGQGATTDPWPTLATELGEPPSDQALGIALALGGQLAVLLGLCGFGFVRLREKNKKVSLGLVLKNRLQKVKAHSAKQDWRAVGVEMTNTANFILGRIAEQGGANQEIKVILEKCPPSLRHELSQAIVKLMSDCEALSFAPEQILKELSTPERMKQLTLEFEKVMRRAIELAET